MWALTSLVLTIVLVIVIAVNQQREQKILDRLRKTLRNIGDTRMKPRSVESGFDRLDNLLHSDETDLLPRQVAAALDELSIGAMLADADGNEILRNRVAAPYAKGRHGDALVENVIQARLHDALRGDHTDEEVRLHGPPEQVFLVIGSPLVDHGELIGAAVLVDDISELQRLDAVRRDFVANVSHELRTPVGALGLLAETLDGEDDPAVIADSLSRIQDEAARMARLIDDLLDLSRIEGGVREDGEPVDLGLVLQHASTAVSVAAEHQGITLELDFAGAPTISGDWSQLVSAVTNLLENAVKYSVSPGKVSGRVVFHGDEVAIVVSDEGIGIPQRDLGRVFERFYRVDRGRSAATGGTGLGLSIVRHVAVNHGGRVELVSQEGVGSTFSMILPLEADVWRAPESIQVGDSE